MVFIPEELSGIHTNKYAYLKFYFVKFFVLNEEYNPRETIKYKVKN